MLMRWLKNQERHRRPAECGFFDIKALQVGLKRFTNPFPPVVAGDAKPGAKKQADGLQSSQDGVGPIPSVRKQLIDSPFVEILQNSEKIHLGAGLGEAENIAAPKQPLLERGR